MPADEAWHINLGVYPSRAPRGLDSCTPSSTAREHASAAERRLAALALGACSPRYLLYRSGRRYALSQEALEVQ
jgi:hypothetical protein